MAFLPDQTTRDFKIPSFASAGHIRSPVCAHPNPNVLIFFSSNLVFFYIVLTASGGGEGGGSCPLAPPTPLGRALYMTKNIVCLCLVERTGERVGRGVLVVKVASGVNIHVMDILL